MELITGFEPVTSSLPNGMGHKSYIFYGADIGCAAGIPGKPRDNPRFCATVPCCIERQKSVKMCLLTESNDLWAPLKKLLLIGRMFSDFAIDWSYRSNKKSNGFNFVMIFKFIDKKNTTW